MKCINKTICILLSSILIISLCGCASKDYSLAYSRSMNSTAYMLTNGVKGNNVLPGFASALCIDDSNGYIKGIETENSYAYGLFDLSGQKVLDAKNMYEELAPASITKIMTAYVALKYGNLDERITMSANCKITESGAQKSVLNEGDSMTLDQALNVMLISSANDIALMIAENVGGTTEHFIEMMNEEAVKLGATHTHFMNPHGLTQEDHYTTVYDLYLIFNEVLKYERFKEIISLDTYSTTYTDSEGTVKNLSVDSTNLYIRGMHNTPEGMNIYGGKTGTTAAAGSCLILYSKDSYGNPYISVILKAEGRDGLYTDMDHLLEGAMK